MSNIFYRLWKKSFIKIPRTIKHTPPALPAILHKAKKRRPEGRLQVRMK